MQTQNKNTRTTCDDIVENILKKSGIKDYDPKVVQYLTEFMIKYTTDLILESKKLANYSKRESITAEDTSFVSKRNRDRFQKQSYQMMEEIAKFKNRQKLIQQPENPIKLPNAEFCLLKQSKHLIVLQEQEEIDNGDNLQKKIKMH